MAGKAFAGLDTAMTDKKSCLIVDDSEVIREIAVRIVTDLGLEAAQASGPAEAVSHCRENKTSAVPARLGFAVHGRAGFLTRRSGTA